MKPRATPAAKGQRRTAVPKRERARQSAQRHVLVVFLFPHLPAMQEHQMHAPPTTRRHRNRDYGDELRCTVGEVFYD